MYELKLKQFEGPLDLLLHLIQQAKIDIKDIFMSEITSQFIDFVEKNQSDMDDVSEFLEVAATLIFIKSKRLLPQKQLEEDEEDVEARFIQRLEEYNRFKQLSVKLREEIENTPSTFTKYKDELVLSDDRIDLAGITLDALVDAFNRIIQDRKLESELPSITSGKVMRRDKYTIVEKMDIIMTKVTKHGKISFEQIFDSGDRGDMIISFLSMLELINLGKLKVYQEGAYDNIIVELRKNTDEQT